MSPGARQFPCERCGAKVEFAPGIDALLCPYCGERTAIPESAAVVDEQDFAAMLARLEAEAETEEVESVSCSSCAALVEPPPASEAFLCPYCGSGIVATAVSRRLLKPWGVLPFAVPRERSTELFREWIRGLWFAPNALAKLARLSGPLQGLYAPYWTFDASTRTRYQGERGDDYQVTRTRTVTRNGKRVTETYTETRTRWTSVSGRVSRDFDDLLVLASSGLPPSLAQALEPWDLSELVPYADEYLSGFRAERYQIEPREGWTLATRRMEEIIRRDVERDIGGDHQRISSLQTEHDDVTFKHVLLPLWICSYRYRDRVYRFLVNARTGEVQGQRPWSWVKVTLAALTLAVAVAIVYLMTR